MCWFIHLIVHPNGKLAAAETFLRATVARHKLYLRGAYPDGLAITNGHCSCDLVVPNGIKAPVAECLDELVQAEAVKSVQVGWLFGDEMPAETKVERLSIGDFMERNAVQQLTFEIWYRVNAPEKYLRRRGW